MVFSRQPSQRVRLLGSTPYSRQDASDGLRVGEQTHLPVGLGARRRSRKSDLAGDQSLGDQWFQVRALGDAAQPLSDLSPGAFGLGDAVQDGKLLWGQVGRGWHGGADENCAATLAQPGRQHQPQSVDQGGQVITADPMGQGQLRRGEQRLRPNQGDDLAGFEGGSDVTEGQHHSLQAPAAERHPDQMSGLQPAGQFIGHGVGESLAQRVVVGITGRLPAHAPAQRGVDADVSVEHHYV